MIVFKETFFVSTVILTFFRRNFASTMSGECSANNSANSYMSGTHSIAYVTAPNEEVGKKLAHGLVSNKLAACVNLIPKLTSIYEWEGKIQEDSEVLLMIKTRTSRVPDLTDFVKKNHPYTVCEVITTPISGGNDAYLKWVSDVVPSK